MRTKLRTSTPASTAAIVADRWDHDHLSDMVEAIPNLTKVGDTLCELNPTGAAAMSDLFASFLKARPKLTPNELMDPRYALNRAVLGSAMNEDLWRDLRERTVGDPLSSALGVLTFAKSITDLYSRLGHVQEAADKAQAAADALDEMLASIGDGDGELDDAAAAALDAIKAQAEAARADMDDLIDDAQGSIDRAVRGGLAKAGTLVEAAATDAANWGMTPGEAGRIDPAERLALATRLASPRMRRIAELFGAIRNLAWGERKRATTTVPEEIYDVEFGGALDRVLPSEMLGLVTPELEMDFLRRLVEGRLLSYALRGNERVGAGAIIYVEDSSGSMAGGKDLWSKAVGLALLGIAKDEKRAFHAICFGAARELYEFAFPAPADFTTTKMLAFAEKFLNSGGTDFASPLDRAVALLDAEFAATGKVSADIVFVTDGEAGVSKEWQAGFDTARARLGFKVYGIALGCPSDAEPLSSICKGNVAQVADIASGEEIRHIFRNLS